MAEHDGAIGKTLQQSLEKLQAALRLLDASVDELYAFGWFNGRERDRIERFVDQEVDRLDRAGLLRSVANGNGNGTSLSKTTAPKTK